MKSSKTTIMKTTAIVQKNKNAQREPRTYFQYKTELNLTKNVPRVLSPVKDPRYSHPGSRNSSEFRAGPVTARLSAHRSDSPRPSAGTRRPLQPPPPQTRERFQVFASMASRLIPPRRNGFLRGPPSAGVVNPTPVVSHAPPWNLRGTEIAPALL